jgi:ABC-type sulfate/molybdate transport systems ATPase subunit
VEVRPRCGANQIVWSFVAFPRAIPPPALLPFAILEVRERYGVTVLFVTHDIDESVYLGDRIVVLTPTPTSVQEQLDVELPQPRDQVQTKERQEFAQRLPGDQTPDRDSAGGDHCRCSTLKTSSPRAR